MKEMDEWHREVLNILWAECSLCSGKKCSISTVDAESVPVSGIRGEIMWSEA